MLPVAELSDQATVVPDGKFTTENWSVPDGATVAVAGLTLVGGGGGAEGAVGTKVTMAVPRTAFVTEFLAVTVRDVVTGTVLGAVYSPRLMVPVLGLMTQPAVTPEGKFRTENCCVPEAESDTVAGLTLTDAEGGGAGAVATEEAARLMVAVAFAVPSAALVAVIVMLCAALIVVGAV